jgi:hypothetical protein
LTATKAHVKVERLAVARQLIFATLSNQTFADREQRPGTKLAYLLRPDPKILCAQVASMGTAHYLAHVRRGHKDMMKASRGGQRFSWKIL